MTLVNPVTLIRFCASSSLAEGEGDTATVTDIMLNEGSTALPYEPYFEGLRSAPVTKGKSVGVNLLNPNDYATSTLEGVTFTKNADGSITANGTATGDIYYSILSATSDNRKFVEPNTTYFVSLGNGFIGDADKKVISVTALVYGKNEFLAWSTAHSAKFTTPSNYTQFVIRIRAYAGAVFNNEVYFPIVAKSSATVPYVPYQEHTLPIPVEVQSLDGYGLGVNEEFYNHVVWESNNTVILNRQVKRIVFDGTESWLKVQTTHAPVFRYLLEDEVIVDKHIQSHFESNSGIALSNEVFGARVYYDSSTGKGVFNVRPTNYADYATAEDWKAQVAEWYAAGKPLELVYTLATPIITDISDLITADNLIGVEGNGTLTFENEYGYAVPSEVTYQLKGVTA